MKIIIYKENQVVLVPRMDPGIRTGPNVLVINIFQVYYQSSKGVRLDFFQVFVGPDFFFKSMTQNMYTKTSTCLEIVSYFLIIGTERVNTSFSYS